MSENLKSWLCAVIAGVIAVLMVLMCECFWGAADWKAILSCMLITQVLVFVAHIVGIALRRPQEKL